jgi:hypothetical protein
MNYITLDYKDITLANKITVLKIPYSHYYNIEKFMIHIREAIEWAVKNTSPETFGNYQ